MTSLIAQEDVNTHFLVHDVLVDAQGRDSIEDFLALDDDLCDNSGFLVNPKFIEKEWVGRTQKIIDPTASPGARRSRC